MKRTTIDRDDVDSVLLSESIAAAATRNQCVVEPHIRDAGCIKHRKAPDGRRDGSQPPALRLHNVRRIAILSVDTQNSLRMLLETAGGERQDASHLLRSGAHRRRRLSTKRKLGRRCERASLALLVFRLAQSFAAAWISIRPNAPGLTKALPSRDGQRAGGPSSASLADVDGNSYGRGKS